MPAGMEQSFVVQDFSSHPHVKVIEKHSVICNTQYLLALYRKKLLEYNYYITKMNQN